jgi:hypothetical protein
MVSIVEAAKGSEMEPWLLDLGEALEEIDWRPKGAAGRALEKRDRRSRLLGMARTYLKMHEQKLRTALCSRGKVRPSIQLGADVITHVSAHLGGLDWIAAALVTPLANLLCHVGLSSFCVEASEKQ